MADMWRSRPPPTPLVYDEIKAGTFAARQRPAGSDTNEVTNGQATNSNGGLKDQRKLTLQETLSLFVSR